MARVRLLRTVCADPPLGGPDCFADIGEHEAKVNPQGAVSVKARDGSWLGVRPAEFEWLDEPPERAPHAMTPELKWYRARVRELEEQVLELQGW
jgi:hypothetical protein